MTARILTRGALGLLAGIPLCAALLAYGVTEQVPVGGIQGHATMSENGKALPKAQLILSPKRYDDPNLPTKRIRTKADGSFSFRNVPAGIYTLEASAKAHSMKPMLVEIKEGKPAEAEIHMTPVEPFLDLYASQRVFTPGEQSSIDIVAFAKESKLEVRAFRLDLDKIAAKGALTDLLQSYARFGHEGGIDPKLDSAETLNFDRDLTQRDIEGVANEKVELKGLKEGFYWVDCAIGANRRGTYLNISKIGMVAKYSPGKMLAYVADLADGKPIANASVQIGAGTAKTTDSSGLAECDLPAKAEEDSKAVAIVRSGESTAVVDLNLQPAPADRETKIYVYTDRPIYRPGDTFKFKGVSRIKAGDHYELPAPNQSVEVQIHDTSDTLVGKQTLKTDARGSFNGSFDTLKENAPGFYRIECTIGGAKADATAELADYRKPPYSVTVEPERARYTMGDRAVALVKCEYYFGGPVVGGKVKASIMRSPRWTDPYADSGDESTYGYGSGEFVRDVEAETDLNGVAKVEFDTDLSTQTESPAHPDDYVYTIQASVADQGDQFFDGQGEVAVYQGDFSMRLEPATTFIQPDKPVDFRIKAINADQSPTSGQRFTLQLDRVSYQDDEQRYTNEQSVELTSDDKGAAAGSVTPKGSGPYRMLAIGKDRNGREIRSEQSLYVEGGPWAEGNSGQFFELLVDQTQCKIGQSMRVLLTQKPGHSALVTLESRGVIWKKVLTLGESTTEFEVPITSECAPNVTLSVVSVHDKQLLQASRTLTVQNVGRTLNVAIQPDAVKHKPGERATFTVKTTDENGKPMPADLSFAVVDESIFALRKDLTNPTAAFYPRQDNEVVTNYSFEAIYLDGGDKGGKIPVRRKFLDTAYWNPTVRTDANGSAVVSLKLPDNLTKWRATAVGLSDDSHTGMGTGSLVASKPLNVRIAAPSYVTVGDRLQCSAVVQNDSGAAASVSVRLDAQGVNVGGEQVRKVDVPAGQTKEVQWELQPEAEGPATLTAKAWIDGGDSDGVEHRLNVQPTGVRRVDTAFLEVAGSSSETLKLEDGASKRVGGVTLRIHRNLAQMLGASLDELIDYPYGCVEQTMSRFVPAVVTAKALGSKLGARAADIPKIVAESLARLKRMQSSAGGWGWWRYDEPEEWMTGLVLEGLAYAKQAGTTIDAYMLERAVKWATAKISTALAIPPPNTPEDDMWSYQSARQGRVRLLLGLAMHGQKAVVEKALAAMDRSKITTLDLARLAIIYKYIGDSVAAGREIAAMKATASHEGRLWKWPAGNGYGSEATATALLAMATVNPTDFELASLAASLMAERKGDGWTSTSDTAVAMIAFSKIPSAVGGSQEGATVSIQLNGETVATTAVRGDLADAVANTVTIPISKFKPGENTLTATTASGKVFVTSEFVQIAPFASSAASGLTIDRAIFKVSPRKSEDGITRLMPGSSPVTSVQAGDLLQVEVTIDSNRDREYLQIEVPVPSNCRITERTDIDDGEGWSYWWSDIVIRDDRAITFHRSLKKGRERFTFYMRAEQSGSANLPSPTVVNMYDPRQFGAGASGVLEVKP